MVQMQNIANQILWFLTAAVVALLEWSSVPLVLYRMTKIPKQTMAKARRVPTDINPVSKSMSKQNARIAETVPHT